MLPVSTTSAIDVGDAELDRGLDRAVEADHLGLDAALLEERAHHPDVRRGDPGAGQLGEVGVAPRRAGEPEPAAAEAQRQHLVGLGAGVAEQVAAGDADVEGALADVQRDVARAQVEELDAVLVVGERELLGVVALPVARLAQDLGRGLGERPLVGDGDAEEGHGSGSSRSEVGVDVVELEARGQHQHLGVVEQLADLLGGAVLALVLGGHPGLRGLLDQLLADRMDAGVELRHGAGAVGTGPGLLGELGPELLERLHDGPA